MNDDGLVVRHMKAEDIQEMLEACHDAGMRKTGQLFDRYLREQNGGHREVLVAFKDGLFAGYLTVIWTPDYEPFRDQEIPEINDFNVMPKFRRNGIGTRLMDEAERIISERSAYSGIGFGMGADYGAAQRMYILRGYVPDGRGLMDFEQPVKYGQKITMSHDLAIYLTKKLR